MDVVRTIVEMRQALAAVRRGSSVGLVPTMGAFHAGHVALMHAARESCGVVVTSLFVNPTQFGEPKDLSTYPRDEAGDAKLAAEAGVDYLFVPSVEEMYPRGYATWIEVEGPARGLEGDFRPGHFRGVAT
ncbi:MAG: pantoate--beta-alanine ligase, partial [Vicinamibacteraceae bacterium]